MWVATQDLPRTAAHPFYSRLNQILDTHDFDRYVEELCQRFCADEVGRPGLPPGRYFRLLLTGYFEGLDAERAIAWRAADSLALRGVQFRRGTPALRAEAFVSRFRLAPNRAAVLAPKVEHVVGAHCDARIVVPTRGTGWRLQTV